MSKLQDVKTAVTPLVILRAGLTITTGYAVDRIINAFRPDAGLLEKLAFKTGAFTLSYYVVNSAVDYVSTDVFNLATELQKVREEINNLGVLDDQPE